VTTAAAPNASARGWVSTEAYKVRKRAEELAVWETAKDEIQAALGRPVPALLSERLPHDTSIYCHHALWHSRVYLACVHGQVGRTIDYKVAASVIGEHHPGRTAAPQWRACTAFLEHLRDLRYIDFDGGAGSHVTSIRVLADLNAPPRNHPAV
jgi:hypothetical protein